jgi:hypothetical protein
MGRVLEMTNPDITGGKKGQFFPKILFPVIQGIIPHI